MHSKAISEFYNDINEFIKTKIIHDIEKFQSETLNHIDIYSILYTDWNSKLPLLDDKLDLFYATAELHKQIETKIHTEKLRMEGNFHFSLYNNLKNKIEDSINNFDDELVLNQEDDHFNILDKDLQSIRLFKKIKQINFSISSSAYKLLKGKKKEYHWKRKVPLKNLATHYLLNSYLNNFLKQAEEYIQSGGMSFNSLLTEQKDIDRIFTHSHIPFIKGEAKPSFTETHSAFYSKIDQLKLELASKYDKFTEFVTSEFQKMFDLFIADYKIIGTVELSRNKFSTNKISLEIRRQNLKLEKSKTNYKNFIAAIFDRNEFYEDLLWYTCLLIGDSYKINKYGDSFINEMIEPTLNVIISELDASIKKIKGNSKNILKIIEDAKDHLRTIIDQEIVPSLINLIASNKFKTVIAEYSAQLNKNLTEFEKEYTFVKPKSLNYRLKADQLKEFSPKEIISPIVVHKLNKALDEILISFESKISKLNTSIISLGRIIEFNLESAKVKFNDNSTSKEEAINIAIEGLLRAKNKTEDFRKELYNYFREVPVGLKNNIVNILEDLTSLSNIDQLLTIKLQVSKEKAIQEVKDNFHNGFLKISEWANWIKVESINIFSASKEKIVGISSKVGLSSSQTELSEAMADYLVRVNESLEKLPYVYKRLFSNDQLNDERMFIGRDEESAKLEKAIKYWCNNQIASVMIIGEKGSGTSSLINIACEKNKICAKIYRKKFSGTIYKEEDLLKYLVKLMEFDKIENTDELIDSINNLDERRIVIVENIEDFFLRIVDGFKAINKLLEIISSTNNKVLWITTCNTFAWRYLCHVVNIKDYFVFNVLLKELDESLVENIILSRHNISGYDLKFIPSSSIEKQKSFFKMDEIEQQEYLKKTYFDDLNKLVSNNIAVALFLWLRSITKSDEERIEVSTELELDFSFLKKLSDQKLFSLMALILHDGLSYEEHSLIFNMSLKSSQLLFATLSDDGIIFKRGKIYKVNFQLYKPIITLLKDKNIFH